MLGYWFFRILCGIIGLLPFTMLYGLSNAIAWLLRVVIRYRLSVVKVNLQYAFPDMESQQLNQVVKASYRNLTDIILESLKSYSLNPDQIRKRYRVEVSEDMRNMLHGENTVTAFAPHYGNWEWGTITLPFAFEQTIYGLIKPVNNARTNRFILDNRGSTGTQMVSIYAKDKRVLDDPAIAKLVVYIADQNPSNTKKALRVHFFGKPCYALQGGDHFARKHGGPVIYLQIKRPKRGQYVITPRLISQDGSKHEEGELTQHYFNLLEAQIQEKPADWLWTHKRWKHQGIYGK